MPQQFQVLNRAIVVLVFVAASITSFTASAGTVVFVADASQLYAAVNDPLNKGAAVILAPGTYVLSATDAANVPRPNGGRLELQQDMSLYGVVGIREAVVIDARELPSSSFTFGLPAGQRTGVIRTGRGSNTIEWLTVLGKPEAAAGIETELPGTSSTRIRVAHVVSDGSSRGIDVRNAGWANNAGRRIDAEIVDNELRGPTQVQGMSEGIRLANFIGADGGTIVAILSGNRADGFQLGCIVANNRSSDATVWVRSSGDRFSANARGCLIVGGLNQAATGVANRNSTVFAAFGSKFVDNTAQIAGIDPGGIRVAGSLSTTGVNTTSDNTVSVWLSGSKVSDNQVVDFEAFGAIQTAMSGISGTNNHVTVALRGVSSQIEVVAVDSLPEDPSDSNTVTVRRFPHMR
jgi:hypothetical protein